MIARYSLPRMSNVWSEENRFRSMLDVEIYACEALAKLGKIPKSSPVQIQRKARFDVERIKEIAGYGCVVKKNGKVEVKDVIPVKFVTMIKAAQAAPVVEAADNTNATSAK